MKRCLLFIAIMVCNFTLTAAEIRLDSVKVSHFGDYYLRTLEYDSDLNTITCYHHYHDDNIAEWNQNAKTIVAKDNNTINVSIYILTNSQWELSRRFIYEYNSKGDMISKTIYPDNQRYSWEFDAQGHSIKSLDYTLENEEWVLTYYTESTWDNDLLSRVKAYSLGYTGNFYLTSETSISYDDQNRMVVSLTTNGAGKNSSKIEKQYTETSEIESAYIWETSTSTWKGSWRNETIYNANGRVVSQTNYNYNDQWNLTTRSLYSYDNDNNRTKYTKESYSGIEWYMYEQTLYTYDNTIDISDVFGLTTYIEYISGGGVYSPVSINNPLLTETSLNGDESTTSLIQYFYSDGEANAIENTTIADSIYKVIRNGQILILRDGKTFNTLGVEIE